MSTSVEEELDNSNKTINEASDDLFQKIARINLYLQLSMSLILQKYNLKLLCLYSGPVKTVLYEGLQEKDVGITEYTTSVPGISGILKHR